MKILCYTYFEVFHKSFRFKDHAAFERIYKCVDEFSLLHHLGILILVLAGLRSHFVSGRQTVGRPRERPRSIGRRLFIPFLGGQTSVSSVRFEEDQTSDGVKKHL